MSSRLLVPFLLLSSLLPGCVAVAVTGAAGVKAGARAIGSAVGSD